MENEKKSFFGPVCIIVQWMIENKIGIIRYQISVINWRTSALNFFNSLLTNKCLRFVLNYASSVKEVRMEEPCVAMKLR